MMEGYNNNKNMVNEEMAVDDRLCLDQLPVEILLIIFDYCHAFDLVRTAQACKRFHSIIRDEFLWYRKRKKALATNQVSSKFRERCNPLLCSHAKWKVTHNWEFGRYETNVLFSQNTKLMPWIQLTNNILWWSGGNQLCGYFRRDPISFKNLVYRRSAPSDFCKFVVKNDYIISGHRDGGIRIWTFEPSLSEGRNNVKTINNAHNRDVETVDETSDVLFSGSSDEIVKAWTSPRRSEIVSNIPLSSIRISDRIWSLAADPTGSKLAIGSAGNRGPPLSICDVENFVASNTIDHKWKRGAGILDMVWENPNTLLTCGYDTCVRKWDLRCGKCVSTWADPTDATIYCLSSDYQYTMVTGTQFNCKTVLWDQRKPHYVQLYFMNLRRMSSPVYSVSFDSCHLYGATDQTTVEVKFSGQPRIKKNYREIMNYKILPAQGRN